jgi:hypothetical protein
MLLRVALGGRLSFMRPIGRQRPTRILLAILAWVSLGPSASQASAEKYGTRQTGTTHVQATLQSQAHGGTLQVFGWKSLDDGNCHLVGGELDLFKDGTAWWTTEIWTDKTHHQDVWHLTFAAMTGLDQRIFQVGAGALDSPGMSDGNGGPPPHYNWYRTFSYDVHSLLVQHTVNMDLEGGC